MFLYIILERIFPLSFFGRMGGGENAVRPRSLGVPNTTETLKKRSWLRARRMVSKRTQSERSARLSIFGASGGRNPARIAHWLKRTMRSQSSALGYPHQAEDADINSVKIVARDLVPGPLRHPTRL